MDKITAVRGFKDILPRECGKWRHVEQKVRDIFHAYGFQEIRIPLLEKTELFRRGIGESTDIVEKEMYTFQDRGEDWLTLRPEATASVIRAVLEHNLLAADPVAKLYTTGPMFRRERPQKGRFRQFHQIDVEVLGREDAATDAEVIGMLMHFLESVGLEGLRLELNSLGCARCRPAFRQAIVPFLQEREAQLCGDCTRRLTTNPLRVFDCKVATCHEVLVDAPTLPQFLCDACRDHFAHLCRLLTGLGRTYFINDRMVRGLDYYMRTTFEVTIPSGGAQNAVVGGGRYDGLVRDLGGADIPGIGFAVGCERLLALMPAPPEAFAVSPLLYIAALGEAAQEKAFLLADRLRRQGMGVESDPAGKSLKSQMKRADRLHCRYVLLLGEQELARDAAPVRDMARGTQETVSLPSLEGYLSQLAP
jgi:histidyl-tRNA synthetase